LNEEMVDRGNDEVNEKEVVAVMVVVVVVMDEAQ
jgi:hypothetical protein